MRVLLDTDMVLDFLLEREPFAQIAVRLFEFHAQGTFDAYVSGITPVNVFYIARKAKGMDKARELINDLLIAVAVCPITDVILKQAFVLPFTDYEDAVQHASATASRMDAMVTRNLDDYKNATLPVFSPADFLNHLKQSQA